MRITNGIQQRRAIEGMQLNLQAMDRARQQVTSGKRFTRASEDPAAAAGVLESSSGLRALEQYKRNISSARARLDVEEGTLNELTNLLTRAKELAVGQMGSTASTATRLVTRAEVDELLGFATELGNTRFDGLYLYGGNYADQRPFPPGGPSVTQPPAGTFRIEIGSAEFLEANHSGQEIFIDSGVLDALQSLSTGLQNDNDTEIADAIQKIDAAFARVQDLTGIVGTRSNRLDVSSGNLEALDVNLRTLRSDLQDADLDRSISELVNRQVAYQAALAANARIFDTTLTDYLR